jgi:hypothetical protein
MSQKWFVAIHSQMETERMMMIRIAKPTMTATNVRAHVHVSCVISTSTVVVQTVMVAMAM